MKKPKAPVKASAVYTCIECGKDATPEDFKTHLREVHKITELKGTRRMVMHVDSADSYFSQYEGEIGGVKFVLLTVNPRRKDDLMRFDT